MKQMILFNYFNKLIEEIDFKLLTEHQIQIGLGGLDEIELEMESLSQMLDLNLFQHQLLQLLLLYLDLLLFLHQLNQHLLLFQLDLLQLYLFMIAQNLRQLRRYHQLRLEQVNWFSQKYRIIRIVTFLLLMEAWLTIMELIFQSITGLTDLIELLMSATQLNKEYPYHQANS